jgi:tetratricopeptide (TPR) repeat protein
MEENKTTNDKNSANVNTESDAAEKTAVKNADLDTAVKKKSAVPVIAISAVAVVVVAAVLIAVVLFVSSSVEKRRIADQLALGDRYLSELDYDQAIAAYLAVIEIDPNNKEAYEGLANAYMAQADALVSNNETDEAIALLESAYNKMENMRTEENASYFDPLIAQIPEKSEDYKKSLVEYDEQNNELPDVDVKEETIAEEESTVSEDIAEEEPEPIPAYEYTEESEALLKNVYDLMAAGDYKAVAFMTASDDERKRVEECFDNIFAASKKTSTVAATLTEGDHILWSPDVFTADYTGTAAGLYKFGYDYDSRHNSYYYFYYGGYENGVRSGEGIIVWCGEEARGPFYNIFRGTFVSDAPNGYGELTNYWGWDAEILNDHPDVSVTKGNYTNGLENGEMIKEYVYYEDPYDNENKIDIHCEGRYTAVMGEAPGLPNTEEYGYTGEEIIYCLLYPQPSVQHGREFTEPGWSYYYPGGKLGIREFAN